MSLTCSPSHQPRALPTVAPTRPKSLAIWKSPVRDVRHNLTPSRLPKKLTNTATFRSLNGKWFAHKINSHARGDRGVWGKYGVRPLTPWWKLLQAKTACAVAEHRGDC